MIEGICIDPGQVKDTWPQVAWLIRQAAEPGDTTFEEFEHDILNGTGLLWLAVEDRDLLAAVVTHLETVKGVKVCTISACGGKSLDKLLPLIEKLEQYGRDNECKAMRVNGRKGWQRVLGDYELKHIALEKELK